MTPQALGVFSMALVASIWEEQLHDGELGSVESNVARMHRGLPHGAGESCEARTEVERAQLVLGSNMLPRRSRSGGLRNRWSWN